MSERVDDNTDGEVKIDGMEDGFQMSGMVLSRDTSVVQVTNVERRKRRKRR